MLHFWMHNLALPLLMITLFVMFAGHQEIMPLTIGLSVFMALALVVFAVNLFMNMRKA